MNMSQTIFVLIVINLVMVVAGFAINNQHIDDFETTLIDKLDYKITGLDSEMIKAENIGLFQVPVVGSIVSGMISAINLAGLAFVILGIVIGNYLTPLRYLMYAEAADLFILKIVGYTGIIYLMWVNIQAVINLYTLLKGSSR